MCSKKYKIRGSLFDCVRKRGSGFYGFKRFKGGGAAHKNQKRREALKYAVFTKGGRPVNLLNLPSDDPSHCMKMQEQNQTTI